MTVGAVSDSLWSAESRQPCDSRKRLCRSAFHVPSHAASRSRHGASRSCGTGGKAAKPTGRKNFWAIPRSRGARETSTARRRLPAVTPPQLLLATESFPKNYCRRPRQPRETAANYLRSRFFSMPRGFSSVALQMVSWQARLHGPASTVANKRKATCGLSRSHNDEYAPRQPEMFARAFFEFTMGNLLANCGGSTTSRSATELTFASAGCSGSTIR